MKRWILGYGLALSLAAAAGEFEQAQELFRQGDFGTCEKLIEKLLAPDAAPAPSPEQRLRLIAIREYLIGNNAEAIARNVETARKIAADPNWLTADLLSHSELLIGRAAEWKERGIPEYQELSDAAEKLLARATDNGDPGIALRVVMLRARNFNLNGEYREPLRLIEEALRFYYPSGQRTADGGAVELLILAGEQSMGIAARSSTERDKIEALTRAARLYLSAAEAFKPGHPRFEELRFRLHSCGETLKLLGCKLKLPSRFGTPPPLETAMIDEMFRQRRFHDAAIVLENRSEPELRLRYAAALCSIGEFEKALSIVETPGFPIAAPALLPVMARNCFAAGRKTEALRLLTLYRNRLPAGPDAEAAATDCARLLLDAGRYPEAAACFLDLAGIASGPEQREQATFSAAQCFLLAKQYNRCLKLVGRLPEKPEYRLLAARTQIQSGEVAAALTELDKLLESPVLPAAIKAAALKFAIDCAAQTAPRKLPGYCNRFLRELPDLPESFGYAVLLAGFHEKSKHPDGDFRKLAEWALSGQPQNPQTAAFVQRCASNMKNTAEREKLCGKLLSRTSLLPAELAAILDGPASDALKVKFWKKYPVPFENRPEIAEVHYQVARLEFRRKQYQDALNRCRKLLAGQSACRYRDVKLLEADILEASGQSEEARRTYQELLLGKLTPAEQRRITLCLARSWERSEQPQKAIATAWSAVPLDGSGGRETRALLNLIAQNAGKIGSAADRQEAEELLAMLPAEHTLPE